MMRVIGFLLLIAIVSAVDFVYDVKHPTNRLNRQAIELVRDIERQRDVIATLRAEWSALNQPARLQQLSDRHLRHLKPFLVTQLGLPHEVPDRPLDLGLFIEQLAGREGAPIAGPEAGTPTGATRMPLVAPVPLPRPSSR
jgi:hypothetical protein